MRWVLLASIALSGCILQDVSLDGKSCPCASGFVCDEAIDVCVRELQPRDAAVDSGIEIADAGSEDASPEDAQPEDSAPLPECNRDSECMAGQICVARACVAGCGTSGCDGTDVCDPSGRCFSAQASCSGASDCNPPDQICVDGACEPGCAVGAGNCTGDTICDPGTGFCEAAPTCNLIEPCPDREFTCIDNVCNRRCDSPGSAPCLGSSSCNATTGRCTGTQLGDFCSGDDQCVTGLCYSTSDPPATFCTTPCGRTADCPIGFSCLPTGNGYRVCAPEQIFTQVSFTTPSGEACTNPNNTCQSAICDPTALTCTERCARDDDCAEFGTDCIVRQQTIQGNTVFSQECAAGPGAGASGDTCSVNSDCASGICNKYENLCADACCTDDDCASDENCLVYDLNNQTAITICQPAGAGASDVGMPCTNATDCASGTCTPQDPFDLGGPKICSVRCCTHDDCGALTNGFCHPIPGVLPGTQAATCFSR